MCCIKVLSSEKIISWSHDGELRIWCLKTKSCYQTINAHSKEIREILVLSENQVTSCSDEKTIKIWHLVSASFIKTIQSENEVISIDVL